MENRSEEGYVTEKILNAFYSGAIPIYCGSTIVTEFFNPKAFINMHDFTSFEDCVDYVCHMSKSQIQQMASEPFYNEHNDIINLLNDNYKDNKTLAKYINEFTAFLQK